MLPLKERKKKFKGVSEYIFIIENYNERFHEHFLVDLYLVVNILNVEIIRRCFFLNALSQNKKIKQLANHNYLLL